MVTKAKALELLSGALGGRPSHLAEAFTVHLLQFAVELLLALDLARPPFIVGHSTAVAHQIGIPILASTDAPIAGLDGANVALHVIIGAREPSDIVTADQSRALVGEHLQEMIEALLLVLAQG